MAKQQEPMRIVDRRRATIAADEAALTGTEENFPVEEKPLVIPNTVIEVDRVYDEPLPIFDRVLIRQGEKETFFAGTPIFIPEVAKKAPNMGVVVATGKFYIVEGKQFPMDELLRPGDMVIFSTTNFEAVKIDGEEFMLGSIYDVKLIQKVHFAIDAGA